MHLLWREDDASEAIVPQHCYICKQKFTTIHHFYDQMCTPCADFNFAKRTELADLSGRTALLTGGRVKIGYQAGLKLLRAGARSVDLLVFAAAAIVVGPRSSISLGAGVFDPAVYPEVEAAMGEEIARYAMQK